MDEDKINIIQHRDGTGNSGRQKDRDKTGRGDILKYQKDISGIRFGRLLVLREVIGEGKGKRGYKSKWLCKCDCGNEKVILRNSLVSGNTKSCGCLEHETKVNIHTKHGMAKTRLWNIWCGMKDRCYRENHKNYSDYGGNGITVCDEWEEDFQSFYDWAIENGYKDDLTIDRIDNDKGYSPDNCRWATRKEQTRNRKNTIKITLAEIAEIDGISYQKAYDKYVRRK